MAIVSGFLVVGEAGKLIQMTQIGVDISSAQALTIVAAPPTGDPPLSLAAGYVNDPVLGEIAQYVTTGKEFTTPGLWYLQLWVQFADGQLLKAIQQAVQVYASL
jgi:hypothetical protein